MKFDLRNLERRRIVITGFEPPEADFMRTTLLATGATVRIVANGPDLPGLSPYLNCDVCLLNCLEHYEGGSPVAQIRRSHRPVVLIGDTDAVAQKLVDLASVDKIDFIVRPLRVGELVLRVKRMRSGGEVDLPLTIVADRRRVLIADDEATTGAMVAAILRQAGFECAVARDGAQALEMAKDKRPDVVLLDVSMPNLNGFETLAALRGMPETRGVPVLMLSGVKAESSIVKGFQLGAEDYIVKPFNSREMVARVDRAVREAESQRAKALPAFDFVHES